MLCNIRKKESLNLSFLEKEMATHSSILAWRITWVEEPGGLQSIGSERAGHDLVSKSQPQRFPGGTVIKNPPANAEDTGDPSSTLGSGRSPGEGNANPLQYSCLGNPMDRGAWRATVHGVAKSQTRLSVTYSTAPGTVCAVC